MNRTYQDYHKRALQLQYHFQDVVDRGNDPRMQALRQEVHELVADIAEEKHPRHIEDRLKIIDQQLMQAKTSGHDVMSYGDIEGLHHSYRQLREDVRRMPNY